MKILIGAYACEPETGSEPGVGWNWAVQAALHGHEVHVITRTNNSNSIEAELRLNPIQGLRFHYFDLPRSLTRLKKRGGTFGILAYYYLWQLGVARLARRLHRSLGFDVVHHVTFVIDWMPSGLSMVAAPFLWGPIGGSTHRFPEWMSASVPRPAIRYEQRRRLLQIALGRFDPLVSLTRRRARLILPFTEEAAEGIPKRHRHKTRPIIHIGVSTADLAVDHRADMIDWDGDLQILTGGRLVHWKGFDLLIEGFARFIHEESSAARLIITGDGPFETHLKQLTQSLKIADRVYFVGRLAERRDIYDLLNRSHIYALPTLRDGPPVAILEAMAAGRPVLCLDIGATAELVPDYAGFKLPVHDREQVIDALRQALARADVNREGLASMGSKARRFAMSHHSWERIGDCTNALYQEIVGADR